MIRDDAIHAFSEALAHDLRTPLAVILGYVELLRDDVYGPLPPAQAETLDRVRAAAEQIDQVIAGMLEIARPADAPGSLQTATVDPLPLVRQALEHAATLARERGATLDVRLPDSMPHLHTDPDRLRTILELAAAAAVRASPRAQLSASASAGEAGLRVELHGTDLAPDVRIPDSLADFGPQHRGMLRLAMLRRLCIRLGARLDVAADPARGTSLTLEVPPLPVD